MLFVLNLTFLSFFGSFYQDPEHFEVQWELRLSFDRYVIELFAHHATGKNAHESTDC